jgi:hypothetical protein
MEVQAGPVDVARAPIVSEPLAEGFRQRSFGLAARHVGEEPDAPLSAPEFDEFHEAKFEELRMHRQTAFSCYSLDAVDDDVAYLHVRDPVLVTKIVRPELETFLHPETVEPRDERRPEQGLARILQGSV